MAFINISLKALPYIPLKSNSTIKRKKIEFSLKLKLISNKNKKINSLISQIKFAKIDYLKMNLFTIILP